MTGRELKEFRAKHGLSQSELAEIVGVKANTVSKWESGIRNIGQSAIKLLEVYDPSLDQPEKKTTSESGFEDIIAERVMEKSMPFFKAFAESDEGVKHNILRILLELDGVKDRLEVLENNLEEKLDLLTKIEKEVLDRVSGH